MGYEKHKPNLIENFIFPILDFFINCVYLFTDAPYQSHYTSSPNTIEAIFPQETELYCVADASWKASTEKIGIGWSLHSKKGTLKIQGSAALTPTNSELEAEAIAMKSAVQQLNRLAYTNVLMLGDCTELFRCLDGIKQRQLNAHEVNEARTIIQDIIVSSKQTISLLTCS